MANIFDYLSWRGDLTFENSPFCEADGVILARYAYMPFEFSERDLSGLTISEVSEALLGLDGIENAVLQENDLKLLSVLAESPRFRDFRLISYTCKTDDATQTQFAAALLKPEKGAYYLCFRGTDNTLVGWKEDFNMGFVCPVPAQKSAVNYFTEAASLYDGDFVLCGHSKGGNLAAYAAAFCPDGVWQRVASVYNFDGPGFDDAVLQTPSYRRVCSKIKTFVPQASIVGMLLGHKEEYCVVHSSQYVAPLQHDMYSWEIVRNHFEKEETVTNSSRVIDETLKGLLSEMDMQKREQLVDAIYTVLLETNVHTLKELRETPFNSAKAVVKSLGNMDEETKSLVTQTLSSLVKYAKQSMKNKA